MPAIPGVIQTGPVLRSPATLPEATSLLSVSTAGQLAHEAAGDARTLIDVYSTTEVDDAIAAIELLPGPQGDPGATGATGPQGDPGPNEVTTATSTNITGILKGDGANVSAATANTDYAAATHASRHASGGADAIKLDDLAAPDDNTDLNATTSAHGLLKKLSNVSTEFLNGQGNWATPAGGGGSPGGSSGQVQYNDGAGGFAGFAGLTVSASSPNVTVTAQGAAHVPLLVKGAASQSANLQEWRDSSNNLLASVYISSSTGHISARRIAFSDDPTNRYITGNSYVSNLAISIQSTVSTLSLMGGSSNEFWMISTSNLYAQLWGTGNKTYTIRGFDQDAVANRGTCQLTLRGGNANPTAQSVSGQTVAGGNLDLRGGNGASGATSAAANGGDVVLTPGTGYGTGRQGLVILANLPTSSPGVTGALWNDGGTLKVS